MCLQQGAEQLLGKCKQKGIYHNYIELCADFLSYYVINITKNIELFHCDSCKV